MRVIKVIYDDGNNGLVKLNREAKRQKKTISEMSNAEILNTCFGMFR